LKTLTQTSWKGFLYRGRQRPRHRPELIFLNDELAEELGLNPETLKGEAGAALFSGNQVTRWRSFDSAGLCRAPIWGFSAQLGDGRALMLGEVKNAMVSDAISKLKGSGRTPFSRGGDGKAVLGPVLREYLMGEAMHALSIPTTRGPGRGQRQVKIFSARETQPGAVFERAWLQAILRVGTFQFFRSAWRGRKSSETGRLCNCPPLSTSGGMQMTSILHSCLRSSMPRSRSWQSGCMSALFMGHEPRIM